MSTRKCPRSYVIYNADCFSHMSFIIMLVASLLAFASLFNKTCCAVVVQIDGLNKIITNLTVRDITKLSGYPRSNVKTRLEQSNLFLASGRFPLQNAIYDNKLIQIKHLMVQDKQSDIFLVNSDNALFFTGLQSVSLFDKLHSIISPFLHRKWRGPKL